MKPLLFSLTLFVLVGGMSPAFANDTCATATNAGSSGTFNDSGNTSTASDDYDPNDCSTSGFPGGNDVVYVISPASDGMAHIVYTNSNDGVLYAATDCEDIDNTCLGADDGKVTEVLDVTLQAGVDVYVICDTFFPGGGAYTISIEIMGGAVAVFDGVAARSWGVVKVGYR